MRWRTYFNQPTNLINITLGEKSFDYSIVRPRLSGSKKLTGHFANQSLSEIVQRLEHSNKTWAFRPSVSLTLSVQNCLVLEQEVPKNARGRARNVLELDLQRIGAFNVDEIYTDHFVTNNTANPKTATAKLVVAKRKLVDPLLKIIAEQGYPFVGISVIDDHKTKLPVELLPANQRKNFTASILTRLIQLFVTLIVAILLLMLFSSFMHYWQLNKLNHRLEQNLAQAVQQAKSITRAQNAENAMFALSQTLRTEKNDNPSLIQIIEELSKLLPLDAYIQKFTYKGNNLRVTGYANSAASLIRILSKSDIFKKVDFISPVTLDPTSRKERYEIQISVNKNND